MTALILLAHGSRHGETAAAVQRIATAVENALPAPSCGGPSHVRIAWLDLIQPDIDTVCAELAAAGVTDAIAVPLLFTDAFHSRIDIPAQVSEVAHHGVEISVTAGLGLGDGVRRTVIRRVIEAARPYETSSSSQPRHNDVLIMDVLIMAVGSSDSQANAAVHGFAADLDRLLPGHVEAAFVVGPEEVKGTAAVELARQRAQAKRRGLIVVPLFTAPGLLWDKVRCADYAGGADGANFVGGADGADLRGDFSSKVPAEIRFAEPLGELLAPTICCRWDSSVGFATHAHHHAS